MTRYYWFGDSWLVGDELQNELLQSEIPLNIYAHLVSKEFNALDIVLGGRGESIDTVVYNFLNVLEQINPDSDKVFFCLTSEIRKGLFDKKGNMKNILPSLYPQAHNLHPHTNLWYKYFDNEYQQKFDFKKSIYFLDLLCGANNIDRYFMNIFSVPKFHNELSKLNWLVPSNRSIADFLLPYTKNYEPYMADNPNFTNKQWQEQKNNIEKYITPNYCHPNVSGHKKIAEELISILKQLR